MISPDEIRVKALKLYETFLRSWLSGEMFFPREINSNKGKSTDNYQELSGSIALLMNSSKNNTGSGYLIKFKKSDTRKHGSLSLPENIFFETENDFLLYIDKKDEFVKFKDKCNLIIKTIPGLAEWIKSNISFVLSNDQWPDLLKVCIYFNQNPNPDLYIRELPVEVHTKFIENNSAVLKSLLDYLLPENSVCRSESSFEKRYHLRSDEPLIRFRLPENNTYWKGINDLSIPLSSFAGICISCDNVFIIENKMTFLTFPEVKNSIVVWGKGFNVEILKCIDWLNERSIYYWGDIDIHGFQILAQMRKYFSHVESLLMDYETYVNFNEYAVEDTNYGKKIILELTESENKVYEQILSVKRKSRLEQERITQKYVVEVLRKNNFKVIS